MTPSLDPIASTAAHWLAFVVRTLAVVGAVSFVLLVARCFHKEIHR